MSHGFVPRRIALADGLANPSAVPDVGAYTLIWNGTTWDRAYGAKLVDLNTNPGATDVEYVLAVNLRTGSGGGSAEVGTSLSPLYVRHSVGVASVTGDGYTPTDGFITYPFPYVYNALANAWERQRQAQLSYSGAGLSQVGVPVHAVAGYYNASPTADPPPSDSLHIVQITVNRAMHVNLRDAAANEVGLVGAPIFVGPATAARDANTGGFLTVDQAHHEIHDGDSYFYADPITLGAAGVQDYLVTTPATTKHGHMTFEIDFLFVTQIDVFEDGDRTGTTLQTTRNRNRNSGNTAAITIHKGTSGGTTDGTNIMSYASGLSTGSGATLVVAGGKSGGRHELILKQNTKYIFRVTSSTASNLINVLFDWYEHTALA